VVKSFHPRMARVPEIGRLVQLTFKASSNGTRRRQISWNCYSCLRKQSLMLAVAEQRNRDRQQKSDQGRIAAFIRTLRTNINGWKPWLSR